VTLARPTAELGSFLRAAAGLLAVVRDGAVADEAPAVVAWIVENLPTPEMRLQFETAESTRLISKRS
jgi:hypothetical protein